MAREPDVSLERSEAIVVRGVDFSETSRIVTLLSPDRGKLACMAAGVKRPKSALAGLLDTLNRLEIVYYWKDGRSIQKLAEATLLDAYAGIRRDLEKNVFAAFPLELAYKTAQENEPSRELYAALTGGLNSMATWDGPARAHAAWQVLRLLKVAGFDPDLTSAATMLPHAAQARSRITGEDLDVLRRLAANSAECGVRQDRPGVFAALRAYVVQELEAEFRSLRVIDRMFE